MPSKIEHELTKFRGEVSDTNEVYTDTVAHLKDLITSLTVIVNTLDADLDINKQKINSAMRRASKGVAMANSAAQKAAGTLTDCTFDKCIIEEQYFDHPSVSYTTEGLLLYYNGKLYFATGTAWELITSAIVE